MSGTKYSFSPMTQDDLTDALWEAFQDTQQEETAALLEECAAMAEKTILQAQKSRVWEAGLPWKSRFSLLAYVLRLGYLKGFAVGQAEREAALLAELGREQTELDTAAAFAECLAGDDFAGYYFDCEATPGAVAKSFIKNMGKLPPVDC